MSSFRWSNIPVPEGHIFLLVLGMVFHFGRPIRLFRVPRWKHLLGWPLLLLGSLLAAWSVAAVKDMDISKPTKIVVSGPYRFSRNPMYLAWNMIYLGLAALINTLWLLVFLPALLVFTHYFVILSEEQHLENRFGDQYREYRSRVRRYL